MPGGDFAGTIMILRYGYINRFLCSFSAIPEQNSNEYKNSQQRKKVIRFHFPAALPGKPVACRC